MGEKSFSSRCVRDLQIVLITLAISWLATPPAGGADLVAHLFPGQSSANEPAVKAGGVPEPVDLSHKLSAIVQRAYASQPTPNALRVAQAAPLSPTPVLSANGSATRDVEAQPETISAPPEKKAGKPSGKRISTTAPLRRPLLEIGVNTAPPQKLVEQMAKTPDNFKIKNYAGEALGDWAVPLGEITQRPPRYPVGSTLSWAAPSVYHRPLYFEQPNLERYGHQYRLGKKHGYGLPSAISAAHFFGTIPVLPYFVGAEGAPCERDYVLGAYRPGSCNPHQWTVPPISLRGAVAEGAAATGLIFFVP